LLKWSQAIVGSLKVRYRQDLPFGAATGKGRKVALLVISHRECVVGTRSLLIIVIEAVNVEG
jgi:hypothetical protein